jgi:hypothetical protein
MKRMQRCQWCKRPAAVQPTKGVVTDLFNPQMLCADCTALREQRIRDLEERASYRPPTEHP